MMSHGTPSPSFTNSFSIWNLLDEIQLPPRSSPAMGDQSITTIRFHFPPLNLLSLLPSWPHLPKPSPPSPPPPLSPRPAARLSRPDSGCSVPLFRPYVAKVPWHGGARGFLSQLFPRYGHYCGPNWSSGKDRGSMLWDRRPVDWLDFCCYCHDIGYDTHDQAKLLKADLVFLECLEKPRMPVKAGAALPALIYRSMCIAGLRNVLIPYRMHLISMRDGPSIAEMIGRLIHRSSLVRQGLQPKPSASG